MAESLSDVILHVAATGFTLQIKREVNQIQVSVEKGDTGIKVNPDDPYVVCAQFLPDDHIYDTKLADCIKYCHNAAHQEYKNKRKKS